MRTNEQRRSMIMQPMVMAAQVTDGIHGDAHAQRFHPTSQRAVYLPHWRREKGTRGAAWLLAELRDRFATGDDFVWLYSVNHESNRTCRCNICRPFALSDPFSYGWHDDSVPRMSSLRQRKSATFRYNPTLAME